MLNTQKSIARRSAVIATLTIVARTAIISPRLASLDAKPTATPAASTTSRAPSDRWLDGLKAKHRQFFDAPAPGGGIPLVHVMNYYDTYNKAYGVKDADIDAVLTFYGSTTFHALSDAVWAKYALGEFLDIKDASTGKPATANPDRTSVV